ncbi:hypothetical protein DSCA_53930 [Desulfosarcina alkanivorans]|uniref:MAP3K TRAFs-binding domain-containing protein n=2 Tax=Desulfosarcina alkanivorans TaxID=571177 RepID=A0A5K7YTT5_9BACT|nr:hypothetical protein DSCA_53930 [Desulfosarcina alkanivorans]
MTGLSAKAVWQDAGRRFALTGKGYRIMRPLCFVLMPFGRKPAAGGVMVDFDAIYGTLIRPAIIDAGLEPLRADEEMAGGIIHKPMFERLILCEYAVADLTTANANVFYELGLRHAVRRAATVLVFADGTGQLPFDVASLRGLPYSLGADGTPGAPDGDRKALAGRLRAARNERTDSPVFQLVEDFPDVQRQKTDVFRDRVRYSNRVKQDLARARKAGVDGVRSVAAGLGDIDELESGVVVDLFLSYRAVGAWDEMIALVDRMAPPLAATVMVQEQLGLALNRAGHGDRAERVLADLIDRRGPSSETCGILGRIYKDRWRQAVWEGESVLARGLLKKAVRAYLDGFETDWRDAYPGVNAITLMEICDPPDPRGRQLIPIVAYAVKRRMDRGHSDYWDHATLLELAVVGRDRAAAEAAAADALAAVREPWEPETTASNLALIADARARRGEALGWAAGIESLLLKRAGVQD